MKKRLFHTSLMAITLGLILSLFIMGVFGPESSTVANALIVNGSNNTYLDLSMDDLVAMPKSTVYAVLSCYGLVIVEGNWGGVNLGFLLNTVGVDKNTVTIQFRATDGYTINLPIEDAMQENVIIAYERDDQPLPEGLRLVVPGANGELWISMITSISQTNAEAQSTTPNSPSIEFPLPSQQSPVPEPRNQSTPSPVIPPSNTPSNSQPQPTPQQDSPDSSLPIEYSYLVIPAIIAAIAAVSGFLFYKRRK